MMRIPTRADTPSSPEACSTHCWPRLSRAGIPFNEERRMKQFLLENKYWILVPMIVLVVLFGVLMLMTEGQSIAPFVYSIF